MKEGSKEVRKTDVLSVNNSLSKRGRKEGRRRKGKEGGGIGWHPSTKQQQPPGRKQQKIKKTETNKLIPNPIFFQLQVLCKIGWINDHAGHSGSHGLPSLQPSLWRPCSDASDCPKTWQDHCHTQARHLWA